MRKFIILIAILLTTGIAAYNLYPEKELPENSHVDSLVVLKYKRILLVYSKGQILKTYKVALGKSPDGDKVFEGDQKTPEGTYSINGKNPHSAFHKNLGISYPDSFHIAQATKLGKSAGGDIKIHGLKNGIGLIGKLHTMTDWTNGCIALTNAEIDELYTSVQIGTPIIIHK